MGTLQIKERYSYAAGEWREPFAEAQVPYDELMGFAKFAATLALRLRLRWSKSNQKRPAAVPTEHNCRSVIQHISPSPEGGPKIRRFQARCSPTAGVPYRSLRVALGPASLRVPCQYNLTTPQARDFDSDSAGNYRDNAAAGGRNTRLLRLMQPQAGTYLMDRLMSSDTRARNAHSESESSKLYTPPWLLSLLYTHASEACKLELKKNRQL